MPLKPVVSKCTLPVFGGVSFKVTWDIMVYVTAQPTPVPPVTRPYMAIAHAGISSVLCVRDPAEYTATTNRFDLAEADSLILDNVVYKNIPLPHIAMSQTMFNRQAYKAAMAINEWSGPGLVHCSTGDRASAAFAAFLITCRSYSNADALAFATQQLALANPQFVAWVSAYQPP